MKQTWMRYWHKCVLLSVALWSLGLGLSAAISLKAIFPDSFYDTMLIENGIMVTLTQTSEYYASMKVYNAQDPASVQLLSTMTVPFDTPNTAKLYRSHVYIPDLYGHYIRRYSLLDPSHPVLNYEYNWSMVGFRDMTFSGNYMLVSTQSIGLRIVNIASENSATEVATIQNGNPFYRVWAYENTAVVLSYTLSTEIGELKFIDISNPAAPVWMGEIDLPDYDYNDDIELVFYQQYMHLLEQYTATRVFSLSIPGMPVLVDTLEYGLNYTQFHNDSRVFFYNGAIRYQFMLEPTTPEEVACFDLPLGISQPLVVDWPYVYVLSSWVYCLDLSDLSPSPEIVGSYDTGVTGNVLAGWHDRLYMRAKIAQLGLGDEAPQIIDSPSLAGLAMLKADDAKLHGLISGGNCKLWSLDDPDQPQEFCSLPTLATETYLSETRLFTIGSGGIRRYDISETGEASFQYLINGYFSSLAVRGNLLWAVEYSNLNGYELSDPLVPNQIASLNLGNQASEFSRKITWHGDYIYLTGYRGEIRIFDVSDPSNPVMAGQITLPMQYDACKVAPFITPDGRMLVASSYANHLISYSLEHPELPEYQEHINLPYGIQSLHCWRDRYYFKRDSMLYAISFTGSGIPSDPASPSAPLVISCSPNPFNNQTSIRLDLRGWQLSHSRQIKLDVYNLRGQKLRSLAPQPSPDGIFSLVWDGRDDGKQSLASGIYFLRLEAEGKNSIRKVMLLR